MGLGGHAEAVPINLPKNKKMLNKKIRKVVAVQINLVSIRKVISYEVIFVVRNL